MASGRHLQPESNMFFGYSIGEDYALLQNAPDPAPGAPLLSDTEQSELNNWFDNMKSDDRIHDNITGNAIHSENWIDIPQFVGSTTSFGQPQDLQHTPLGNHVFPHDVFGNIPLIFTPSPGHMPQSRAVPSNITPLLASASRSNSSPALSLHMGAGVGNSFSGLPGHGLGIEQPPSEDMVAAAHTLLLNNHHGTRHASFNYGPRLQLGQQHHNMTGFDLAPGPPHPGPIVATSPSALLPTMGHNNGPQLRTAHLSSSSAPPIHLTADLGTVQPSGLVFTADANTAQQTSQQVAMPSIAAPVHRQGLQWGTDDSFGQKQFTPRSHKETSEALMNVHLKSMECLAPNHSTGMTRPSSPTYDSAIAPLQLKTRTASFLGDVQTNGNPAMPPRKRRKAKSAQEGGDGGLADEDAATAASGAGVEGDENDTGLTKNGKPRKRKAKTASNGNPPSQASESPASPSQNANGTGSETTNGAGPAPTKRRRSAAVAKPPRENLTEAQKRENHIKSEQKRRTLIKTGFDDLCILVPGLQGGNLSKSLVLTTAASWLTELLEGNKRLQSQLSSMNGAAFPA
ncbi:hypothetical protein SCUCBS95973_003563 [Sporothrix curviconia]|uniref:BHLH domain-containing protein n=1 Tax=Sporothrix curviconia TaxID=1260050 RepID=A0ABP0BHI3_9PEZI